MQDDLISRQAALLPYGELRDDDVISVRTIRDNIKYIPTVQPQKVGKWIPMTVSSGRDSWKCSVCGRRARGKIENLPYCHCGAKMEEGE